MTNWLNHNVKDYEGEVGNRTHITRVETGHIPVAAVADLKGAANEQPGEHRTRKGQDWESFKQDIANNGIKSPIFITVDHGEEPKISEGNHRRDAALELGMTHIPAEVRYFGHAEQHAKLAGQDTIDLYHRTTPENAQAIYQQHKMNSVYSDRTAYFSTFRGDEPNAQADHYGTAIVHVKVPTHLAEIDDEFPSGEQHYRVPVKHLRPEHFVEEPKRIASLQKEATWADVRAKAQRIRAEGGVRIIAHQGGTILGHIKGDNHIYESSIVYVPGTTKTGAWFCACKWASYSWGRSGHWRKFEGRRCSHVLALQYEAQSRRMFGRTVLLDINNPHWMDTELPTNVKVPGEYRRDLQSYSGLYRTPPTNDKELLMDAVGSWKGDPGSINIHLSHEVNGDPEPDVASAKEMRAHARALLNAAKNGKTNDMPLYRGQTGKRSPRALSEWSEDPSVAKKWAKTYQGQVHEIAPGKGRGIRVSDHSAAFEREKGWILHNAQPTTIYGPNDFKVQRVSSVESSLKWKKQPSGRIGAVGKSHEYSVEKGENKGYDVRIWDRSGNDFPIHRSTHDTKGLAKSVAHHHELLGDDYKPHENGAKNRSTTAIQNAYDEDMGKLAMNKESVEEHEGIVSPDGEWHTVFCPACNTSSGGYPDAASAADAAATHAENPAAAVVTEGIKHDPAIVMAAELLDKGTNPAEVIATLRAVGVEEPETFTRIAFGNGMFKGKVNGIVQMLRVQNGDVVDSNGNVVEGDIINPEYDPRRGLTASKEDNMTIDQDPEHALPVTYGDDGAEDESEVLSALRARIAKAGSRKTALKNFSAIEKQQLIDEGLGTEARNLGELDLTGTHYKAVEQLMPHARDEWTWL